MYYDKQTWFIVNQSVNEFNTQFMIKFYWLSQDDMFPLDIVATFFKNLSPYFWELLVSALAQAPVMPPTKTN